MSCSPAGPRRGLAVPLLAFGLLLLSASVAPPLAGETPIPPDHWTKAELTGFRSTASYAETIEFLIRLERTSPFLKLDFYGRSGAGRRMPVVVVSKEKAFTPAEAWKSGKPVVLVLNGIHAGEIDGKDACLSLLRDVALLNRKEVLDALTLLVVPIYNVDGHERVSPYNRPNQDGPVEGMGFRTTARGLDLNRDFLKADAPETRALLALVDAWKPDLFVDDHVTDGSDIQATLTVAYGAEPATPPALAAWLEKVVPKALLDVEEAGYLTAPYVEWVDWLDPRKGIDLGPSEPRYGTGYFPLRSVPAILVENHAMKPYEARVKANRAFLDALLSRVARDPKALLSARAAAREEARKAPAGSPFVLEGETDTSRGKTIDFRAFEWTQVTSFATGRPRLVYDPKKPVTVKLPVFRHAKAKTTVPRPAAYLVPPGWPAVEERLVAHGIRYRKLAAPRKLPVGTYRASDAKLASSTYQGRVRVTAKVVRAVETRDVPAGTLYVPLDTELAPVVMHLLEPEGPDSLFSWGELSSALESKEWIDPRVLDPLAREMVEKDPKVAAEWEERMKDPAFSGDARARHRFFYSRTPYWDETQGLLPVYRLEAPLSEEDLSPVAPPSASAASPG
ncbi:peptidase M14 [Acidobacteria bacterium ACD]|nr:peptidase M14 [Acidobacteria bacterium ACB2]MDL1948549.1 peptidase M14 [Acidobacteria bacterium ACD]